jgi:MFS family permease
MLGLAMGIYGLTQGLLQLPFGMASDRFGRKRVIVLGLLIFAVGSFVAAAAPTLQWLLVESVGECCCVEHSQFTSPHLAKRSKSFLRLMVKARSG